MNDLTIKEANAIEELRLTVGTEASESYPSTCPCDYTEKVISKREYYILIHPTALVVFGLVG